MSQFWVDSLTWRNVYIPFVFVSIEFIYPKLWHWSTNVLRLIEMNVFSKWKGCFVQDDGNVFQTCKSSRDKIHSLNFCRTKSLNDVPLNRSSYTCMIMIRWLIHYEVTFSQSDNPFAAVNYSSKLKRLELEHPSIAKVRFIRKRCDFHGVAADAVN